MSEQINKTDMTPYEAIERVTETVDMGEGDFAVIANHIGGIPLFAWWVFYIFVDPAFVGTTLTDDLPEQISGPFETQDNARKYVTDEFGVDVPGWNVLPF